MTRDECKFPCEVLHRHRRTGCDRGVNTFHPNDITLPEAIVIGRIHEDKRHLLRLAGSLKLGVVQAISIMRTLQISDRPTKLAQAVAELAQLPHFSDRVLISCGLAGAFSGYFGSIA